MRRQDVRRLAAIAGVGLGLLLALPPAARARKLQMSGTWAIRTGRVLLPLQFAQDLGGAQMTVTSMGDLSKGYGSPNGPIRNGRVIYRTGANQFGGAMQLGLGGGGTYSFPFNFAPLQIGNAHLYATVPTPRTLVAGRGIAANPATRRNYLPPGVVTQPTMTPEVGQLVLYPGPKLTTMLGLTTTGPGPKLRLPVIGTSAGGCPLVCRPRSSALRTRPAP